MQKQTIALVDDDRNILTSLSIALEKEGFKVQTYIDGESALIGLTRTPTFPKFSSFYPVLTTFYKMISLRYEFLVDWTGK